MSSSRISGFYKLSLVDRLRALVDRGVLSEADHAALLEGTHRITPSEANRQIENVIATYCLPWGLGLNLSVNGREHVVPMVVEEPSIVAGVSGSARIVRDAGGFRARSDEPLLLGHIQLVGIPDIATAQRELLENRAEIVNLANSLHPNMVGRGGGARDVETTVHPAACAEGDMLVVHLLVDTRDAMGANMVNSMCEGVAPLLEKMTDGRAFLRILSNLADRALVRARCSISPDLLGNEEYTGEQVRDGIVLASDFAAVDPYRAATHNKGIMNGIDAVAVATGNDWRAIEAAAHAYAGQSDGYTSLSRWYKDERGDLAGEIELPLKVGTVGGQLEANRAANIALRMMSVGSARELAEVMASVGLAQNLAALRALSTAGIQRGHMTLHARSVAAAAGATSENFEPVLERLIESGEIKVWKAKEIIADLEGRDSTGDEPRTPREATEALATACGKLVLLGEHAVVYGRHALAGPLPIAVRARVQASSDGTELLVPRWGVELRLHDGQSAETSLHQSAARILSRLGVRDEAVRIEVFPQVPRAMGLGSSAAVAVAVIRAVAAHFGRSPSEEEVNALAYECERLAHGTPSGIDNTVATYGRLTLFKAGDPPMASEIQPPEPLPVVIGLSRVESLTARMVGRVRESWERNSARYERIFSQLDGLTLQAAKAVREYRLEELGELMNLGQGLLNALQVSSRELEELVEIARTHGALGAKLTGGGGGGSIVALAPDRQEEIAAAIRAAGYEAIVTEIR